MPFVAVDNYFEEQTHQFDGFTPIHPDTGNRLVGYRYTPISEDPEPKYRLPEFPSNGHYLHATCSKCGREEFCHYPVQYEEVLTMFGMKYMDQRLPPICQTCYVEDNQ